MCQVSKLRAINTSLETKAKSDQDQMMVNVKAKTNEILDVHNQNLSIKIQMRELEDQVRHDLEVRGELHTREIRFLKNKISEQEKQIRTQTLQHHLGHQLDQDGE